MLNSRESTSEEAQRLGLFHRVYVPESGSQGKPLVVFVHGRAGNAQVMWVFSKALEKSKPCIISPQATLADINNGFSWWPIHEKQTHELSPEIKKERVGEVLQGVEQVKNFVAKAHLSLGTDPAHTYAAGFSQGAALLGTLSLIEPQLFKGVALLSGFIPYAIFNEPGIINEAIRLGTAPLPSYFMYHGTQDPVISLERALQTKASLEELKAKISFHEEAVTHKVGSGGIRALGSWFDTLLLAKNV